MTTVLPAPPAPQPNRLVDLFEYGLDSPICLTWELTYACNLSVRALPLELGAARSARAHDR